MLINAKPKNKRKCHQQAKEQKQKQLFQLHASSSLLSMYLVASYQLFCDCCLLGFRKEREDQEHLFREICTMAPNPKRQKYNYKQRKFYFKLLNRGLISFL